MKILITSIPFSPSVGGIETVTACLAEEFSQLGHSVRVVTQTPGPPGTKGFQVIRTPSLSTLINEYRWSDVVLQNNISLKFVLPRLIVWKPLVVITQTWIYDLDTGPSFLSRLKLSVIKRSASLAISNAIADHLKPAVSRVIGNPFDDQIFNLHPEISRDRDLLFVGRLVSSKAASMVIQAHASLVSNFPALTTSIVGAGPEEENLKLLARELGVSSGIRFPGPLFGEALAREYSRHRILAIPSLWHEPFGIVALEGIACGCVCVASRGGGLPDAVGNCGLLFRNGDQSELTASIHKLLSDSNLGTYLESRVDHLTRFSRKTIASACLDAAACAAA